MEISASEISPRPLYRRCIAIVAPCRINQRTKNPNTAIVTRTPPIQSPIVLGGGKVKKRTLANITKIPPDMIENIRDILRCAALADASAAQRILEPGSKLASVEAFQKCVRSIHYRHERRPRLPTDLHDRLPCRNVHAQIARALEGPFVTFGACSGNSEP